MTNINLPRCAPEAQGVRSRDLLPLLEALERSGELHTMMLLRRGAVIAEGGWSPYEPSLLRLANSVSKSFTSTIVGIAIDEGLFGLGDRVVSFFPEHVPAGPDSHLAAMTVEHLLTMSSGHAEDTTDRIRRGEDWVGAFLALPVEHEPGTVFVYNSGATYMLSAIVQRVTGETLLQYGAPRLLEPLGIAGVRWESCPRGIIVGGWGLSASTEHFAKLGQLYLNKGVWQGRRLLSEAWTEAATGRRVDNGSDPASDWNQGYGYQFWRCRHGAYRGDGAFGQYVIVLPEQEVVLALTSGVQDMQAVLNAVWEGLLPALAGSAEALPPDPEAEAALAARLAALSVAPPVGAPGAAAEGRSLRLALEPNPLGLERIELRDDGAVGGELLVRRQGETLALRYGRSAWALNGPALADEPGSGPAPSPKLAASGCWLDEAAFRLTVRTLETAYVDSYTCRLDGDRATVEYVGLYNLFGPGELVLTGTAEH